MKRKAPSRNPPAQRAANELWQMLGATSNEAAVKSARELIGAVQAEPLILMLSINRATGRVTVRHSIGKKTVETDIRLLRSVLSSLDENLVNDLAQLAEARG